MSMTVTYDPVLSRVRIGVDGNLVRNPGFDVDAASWNAQGGTLTRVTTPNRTPPGAALLTPNGVAAIVLGQIPTFADMPAVTSGEQYTGSGWVRSTASLPQVSMAMTWWDAAGTPGTTSASATTALPNSVWTQYSVTAAAPAVGRVQLRARIHGTPTAAMTMNLDDMAVYATAVATFDVERSTNGVNWTPVRGGLATSLTNGVRVTVNDYEFPAGVPVTYRVTYRKANGTILGTTEETITVQLDGLWLKSISRPFLNHKVTGPVYMSAIDLPERNGIFNIVGRSRRVAVTDVRVGKELSLELMTPNSAEADAVELLLASGDPLFVQPHTTHACPIPMMYAVAGRASRRLVSNGRDGWFFTMPLSEVAAPGPDVIPATVTYQNILDSFPTYAALLAAEASYATILERISDPTDVIVP